MLRILIAGCGDVGCRLGQELARAGHQVWGLRRNPQALPEEITPLAADLADPSTLSILPPSLDVVFYMAAAGRSDEATYRRVYFEGLSHVLDALHGSDQGPRRVFFTSSTAVYGQEDGSWVDEESETAPQRFSGQILLEAERRLLDDPIPGTVIRLGGIYGPGRTFLVDQVRGGTARLGPPRYTNRIHADDCAGFLAHLMNLDVPLECYLGVDDDPAERNEVLRWMSQQLGIPEPPRADRVPGRGGNKRCSNRRLHQCGYTLRYPTYRDGYATLL